MRDSGFRIPDSRFQIPDSGFRILIEFRDSGIRNPESGIWNLESGIPEVIGTDSQCFSRMLASASRQYAVTRFGSPSMKRSAGLTQLPSSCWRLARAATRSARQSWATPAASVKVGWFEQRHGLGEGVVIVIQPDLAHAGVFFDGVVLLDVIERRLDAGIIGRQTGVDHALEAGVGHAAIGAEAAVVGGAGHALTAARGGVNEAAVVDLAGPGLVVELALEVLAARHEDQARSARPGRRPAGRCRAGPRP